VKKNLDPLCDREDFKKPLARLEKKPAANLNKPWTGITASS